MIITNNHCLTSSFFFLNFFFFFLIINVVSSIVIIVFILFNVFILVVVVVVVDIDIALFCAIVTCRLLLIYWMKDYSICHHQNPFQLNINIKIPSSGKKKCILLTMWYLFFIKILLLSFYFECNWNNNRLTLTSFINIRLL